MQKATDLRVRSFSEKEIPAMRYFFDFVGHERSELDYTGRILPTPEEAYDAAELMALDL